MRAHTITEHTFSVCSRYPHKKPLDCEFHVTGVLVSPVHCCVPSAGDRGDAQTLFVE